MISLLTLFGKKYDYVDIFKSGSDLTLYFLREHKRDIVCLVSEFSDTDAMEKKILKVVNEYDISKDLFVTDDTEKNTYRYAVPVNHFMKPVKIKIN